MRRLYHHWVSNEVNRDRVAASEPPAPRASHSLPPVSRGRVFGKFRLLASLGSGGMGEVFLAMTRGGLGVRKLNVIKRLRHFAEDDQREHAQQMFLNEARVATLLNHPNVVQTYDVGIEDGRMYLVMEYLEGQSLHALYKHQSGGERRVDDRIILKMISDTLFGLHYAHELCDYDGKPLNIVHRDLSPHNIIITYEGVAKIVDFGIAKTSVSTKTELGVIKGKFAYMAPEQAGDGPVDRRADVFVMGIGLWELLSGQRLVARRNDLQTITRLLNDDFQTLSSVRPDIDPTLNAIVMKALHKDPSLRYQSALEMREALENCLAARFRPVRQEELGKCVTDLFKEDRAAIQQRIQECVAAALEDPDPDQLPTLRGPHETTPSFNRRNDLSSSGSNKFYVSQSTNDVPTGTTAAIAQAATPARPTRSAAMAATVVVLMAVGAYLGMRDRDAPPVTASAQPPALINTGTAVEAPAAPAPVANAPVVPTMPAALTAAPAPATAPAPEPPPASEPTTAAAAPDKPAREGASGESRRPVRESHSAKRRAREEASPPAASRDAQAAPHQRVFNTEL